MRLFEPFWRTIAISVIKDLQSRPQMAQKLCDILNIPITELLRLTQRYTIPYLVLMRKKDVLKRVAEANGHSCSVASLCLRPEHLGRILAYLLLQKCQDPATMINSVIASISPDLSDFNLEDCVKGLATTISIELLIFAAEAGEAKASMVSQYLKSSIKILTSQVIFCILFCGWC
jgi:serine/threonine-protein kinase ATR